MKVLGIDYGRKKIGLAVGDTDSRLAEPLQVLRCDEVGSLVDKIEKIIKLNQIDKAIVGISEGKMAEETKAFVENLRKALKIPVDFRDETLTTQLAEEMSIKAGIKRKKRKLLEDAYSAALILQSYLDSSLY